MYLFGDGFNRIRVNRRRNWRKKNSLFKSTPISVDEALITYANYLQLITGEPVTKEASSTVVLQVIVCMMYDIIVIEISVFVRPNGYDKPAFFERTPRLWGPFSKTIRTLRIRTEGLNEEKSLHFQKCPDTCGWCLRR